MNTYFMGIDVSKGYADFVVLDSNKDIALNCFKLDDTQENHEYLIDTIKKIIRQNNAQLYCGLESSGGYENN